MNKDLFIKGTMDGKPIAVQCCMCKRMKTKKGGWGLLPIPPDCYISHTYCETCADIAIAQMRRELVSHDRTN